MGKEFNRFSRSYDEQALVQSWAAQTLMELWGAPALENGLRCLELGCGTGLLSHLIADSIQNHQAQLTVCDLSGAMLEFCQERLARYPFCQFLQQDAEELEPSRPIDILASSYALQWFQDPAATLRRYLSFMRPGSYLLLAFPTHRSFPEWRGAASRAALPCTMNPLPDPSLIKAGLSGCQILCAEERSYQEQLSSPMAFFRALRRMGASTCLSADSPLQGLRLRRLCSHWEEPHVTWSTGFVIAQVRA